MANEFTLADLAQMQGDQLSQDIVKIIYDATNFFSYIPFQTNTGGNVKKLVEKSIPTPQTRAINEEYSNQKSEYDVREYSPAIFGDSAQIDRILADFGSDRAQLMQRELRQKIKACILNYCYKFINASKTSNLKEFDGIKELDSVFGRTIAMGTNGATLTYDKLDELIDSINGRPTVLLMNKGTKRYLKTLNRAATAIYMVEDDIGRPVDSYDGIPIITLEDAFGSDILPQTETKGGSGAVCSSIYAVRFEVGQATFGFTAGQGLPKVIPVGNNGIYERFDVEWTAGVAVFDHKSFARLEGVKIA